MGLEILSPIDPAEIRFFSLLYGICAIYNCPPTIGLLPHVLFKCIRILPDLIGVEGFCGLRYSRRLAAPHKVIAS